MEQKVLLKSLVDSGTHIRAQITPTAIVTDKGDYPAGMFWDVNKTLNEIVAGASESSNTLEKAENNLNSEINRAKAESVASATYSNGVISFLNVNGEVIAELSAVPFIKDHMVSEVYVEDKNMYIVFNTDAGKDTIIIPVSDVFDPDLYYTKELIDDMIGDIETLLSNI